MAKINLTLLSKRNNYMVFLISFISIRLYFFLDTVYTVLIKKSKNQKYLQLIFSYKNIIM